ncbi:MAG: 4-oxalocrotonate decarboxylase [Halobacteriovoraceae bacterium]|nr:4-oxalocrotonate decarboxylase [Halobacteriovoraceae bacterium]|tara:strand:+ start:9053 stop:9829 length:777 start_codon:yes stop_codon:yes gene_type:complete
METEKLLEMAKTLHDARINAKALPQFSSQIEFSRSEAYSIQEMGIQLRVDSGEKYMGLKMGLTSEKKRQQMNLDAPLYGVLTDKMQVSGVYQLKGQIHPKIEPEIVFYINDDLSGDVTREEVLNACSAVGPALEILDSRYEGFKYFSMEDVIADNSSSSQFILGPKIENFKDMDLKNLKMEMKVNGETVEVGTSSDISGDPVVSVIQLASLMAERDQYIPAGSFVLAGAATAAVKLEAGMKISLDVDGMQEFSVKIEG